MIEISIEGMDTFDKLLGKIQGIKGEHTIPIPDGMSQDEAVNQWINQQLQ